MLLLPVIAHIYLKDISSVIRSLVHILLFASLMLRRLTFTNMPVSELLTPMTLNNPETCFHFKIQCLAICLKLSDHSLSCCF